MGNKFNVTGTCMSERHYVEKKIKSICEKYNILMMLLFGSYVKGKYKKGSDIDIGVLFEYDNYIHEEVITEIMNIFKGHAIDVVLLNHSDPVLKYEIISNYKIIYCKDKDIFINFYINSIKQYSDIQKMLKLERVYLKNFIGGMRSGICQCNPPQVN